MHAELRGSLEGRRTVAEGAGVVCGGVGAAGAEADLACEGGVPQVDAVHAAQVARREAVHAVRDRAQRRHHACVARLQEANAMQVRQILPRPCTPAVRPLLHAATRCMRVPLQWDVHYARSSKWS